jgi:hypothetical protein
MSGKKELIVSYKDFDANRIVIKELQENSSKQKNSWVNYNHPELGDGQQLLLQMPWFVLNNYGVPTLGEYYKTDKDRCFVKTPFDKTNKQMEELFTKLEQLDKVMDSEKMRIHLFGDAKKGKKYTYVPICRQAPEPEDENEPQKPNYMKLKIDTSYPEGEVKTRVLISKMVNGIRERTPVEVSTIDEFRNHVRYMSNLRFIIRPVKVWAQDSKLSNPQYGMTFKIFKAEVEPREGSSTSISNYLNVDSFLDSEEDEPKEMAPVKTEPVKTEPVKTEPVKTEPVKTEPVKDSDSEDDSEDDTPPSPVVKRGKNTKTSTKSK